MRVLITVCLALSLCLSAGCAQAGDPLAPGSSADDSTEALSDDPYIREITGLVTGSTTLNGATQTDPTWDDQPFGTAVTARLNDLIFFTHKVRMTDNAPLTLAASYAGATVNYGGTTQPGNNLNAYEVRLVTRSEPITLQLWNTDVPGGLVNAKGAIWEYSIKTAPRNSTDEPDADNNTGTVSDRTMGNSLPLNTIVNRSMFSYSTGNRDVEEWWKLSLPIASSYKVEVNNYNPRYGTWKYRIQVRNPDGSVLSTGSEIQTTETATTFTFTTLTAGTHYIQIAGFQKTKTLTSNVYYSPYWIRVSPVYTASVATWGGTGATVEPRASTITDGTSNTILVGEFNGTVDFDPGPGVQSRTASALGASGYCLSLSPLGEFQWVSVLTPDEDGYCTVRDVVALGDGSVRMVGDFKISTDFDPGAGTEIRASNANSADTYCLALSPAGAYQWVATVGGGGAESTDGLAIDGSNNVIVVGEFQDATDFDPGAGTETRTPAGIRDAFQLQLDPDGSFQRVDTFGGTGASTRPSGGVITDGSSNTLLVGELTGTADFDPGAGTNSRTSAGGTDIFCVKLDSGGAFNWCVGTAGLLDETVELVARTADGQPLMAGTFAGTIDFDPGVGIDHRTAIGTGDGYLWALQDTGAERWARTFGGDDATVRPVGSLVDGSSNTILIGEFSGPVDFDPGAGTEIRTSQGNNDAFAISLSPDGVYRWVATIQGTGTESCRAVTLHPSGMPWITGAFSGTADFDSSPLLQDVTATGTQDGFLLRLKPTGSW